MLFCFDRFNSVVCIFQSAMDEGSTRVPPASPVTKLKGGDKRRSSESPRSFSPSSGKVVPHYLRASTGSCHEFCKHGKPEEHVSDAKDSRPWRKPVIGNGRDKLLAKESEVTAIKKNVVVKPKPLVDHKIQSLSKETINKQVSITFENINVHTEQASSDIRTDATGQLNTSYGPETTSLGAERVKQEISMASENVIVTAEEASIDTEDLNISKKSSLRSPSPISSRVSVGRKSMEGRKAFEARKSIDGGKSVDEKKSFDEKKSVVPETTQKCDGNLGNAEKNSEGSMSAGKMKSIERRKNSPENKGCEESKSLNLESDKKDDSLWHAKSNGKSELLKKHVAAPKPKILKTRPPPAGKPPSPLHPSSGTRGKTSDDNQVAENLSTSKLDSKRVGAPTTVSPSSRSSANGDEIINMKKVRVVRVISSVRRQRTITKVVAKDPDDLGPQEDTDDAAKIAPEKKSLGSAKMKVASSESLLPFAPSVSKSTVRSRISYMPSRLKNLPAKSEQKIAAKDACISGVRKSKPVDLELENHKSTTLQVRRGTLIGDTAQINRRSLKKRIGAGGTTMEKNNADSFLLRRPSARRKKNVQVLFNKVIEETASRLVRTSKSKVLALVGAFETVISIQRKSSAGSTSKAKKISSSSKTSH
ncbi:hypothetical protein QQ045_023334 [Rhodiola kirilowii]